MVQCQGITNTADDCVKGENMKNGIRLHKFLSLAGISSRRKAEELISQGRVKVNGSTVTAMGIIIRAGIDTVEVNDKTIGLPEKMVYIMLNKPVGYITTASDQFKRPTVVELTKNVKQRIYPVGRLDYNTSGLLLLTNDGEFAYRIMHPSFELNKTYVVKITGHLNEVAIKRLEKGIKIDGYVTSRAQLRVIKSDLRTSVVEITIHEGRNRQVRKMFNKVGHQVLGLKRVSIDGLTLDNLREGEWRYLTKNEENNIKKQVGMFIDR